MEDKTPKPTLEWQVVALGESGNLKGPIPIDAMKFSTVKKLLLANSYRKDKTEGEEIRYMHHSIRGLYIIMNETKKLVRARGETASSLSQAADDLQLPSYRAG